MRCPCWRQNCSLRLRAIPARQLALIGKVEAAIAAKQAGRRHFEHWTAAPISAMPTAIAARSSMRRWASGFRTILSGLEAKGFFRPDVLPSFLQCPSSMAHSPVPIHVPRANHTSSYGLIYARSRLRLDRLCRNGGRAGFFP